MQGEQQARDYIQRQKQAHKPIDRAHLQRLTGLSEPEANRFLQSACMEFQASQTQAARRDKVPRLPRSLREEASDAKQPVTPSIVDRLKLMLEAIG